MRRLATRAAVVILALAGAGLLAGCATVESQVHVPYTAHGAASPGPSGARVSVSAVDARITNRGRISTKKNGYGMDMAAIRSTDDIAQVVQTAIAGEFATRGYQIAAGGAAVEAKVTTFYNDFKIGIVAGTAEGTVDLTVSVSRDGRLTYTRDYHGVARKTVEIASGTNAAQAISLALGAAIDQMFADPRFIAAVTGAA